MQNYLHLPEDDPRTDLVYQKLSEEIFNAACLAIASREPGEYKIDLPEPPSFFKRTRYRYHCYIRSHFPLPDEKPERPLAQKQRLEQLAQTRQNTEAFHVHHNILGDGFLDVAVNTRSAQKPTSLIWKTTSGKLSQLQDYGCTRSEAISSQVIETLGRYRALSLSRWIDGVQSDQDEAKLKILNSLNQDIRDHIQPLERLINNRFPNYHDHILQDLEKYKQSLNHELNSGNIHPLRHIHLTRCLQQVEEVTQTITDDSDAPMKFYLLQELVRALLNATVAYATSCNEQITLTEIGKYSRGEFHAHIVEAEECIRDYRFDPNTPITKAHQLNCCHDDIPILWRSDQHGIHSKKSLETCINVIHQIENPAIQNDFNPQIIITTSPGWMRFYTRISYCIRRLIQFFKPHKDSRLTRHAAGLFLYKALVWMLVKWLFCDMGLGLLNVLEKTLFPSDSNTYIEGFMDRISKSSWVDAPYWTIQRSDPTQQTPDEIRRSIKNKIGINQVRWGTIAGNVFHWIGCQIIFSFSESLFLFFITIGEFIGEIIEDWQDITRDNRIQQSTGNQFVELRKKTIEDILTGIFSQNNKNSTASRYKRPFTAIKADDNTSILIAQPTHSLHPGKPHDWGSFLIDTLIPWVDIFRKDMAIKHPFLFTTSSLTGVLGAACILYPHLIQSILTQCVGKTAAHPMMQALTASGPTFADKPSGQAFSTLISNPEAIGVLGNLIRAGDESLIAETMELVRDNPALVSTALFTAWGIGYVVSTYGPLATFFSEELSSRSPYAGQFFIGLKLSLIATEATTTHHQHEQTFVAQCLGSIFRFSKLSFRCLIALIFNGFIGIYGVISWDSPSSGNHPPYWIKAPFIELWQLCQYNVMSLIYNLGTICIFLGKIAQAVPRVLLEAILIAGINFRKLAASIADDDPKALSQELNSLTEEKYKLYQKADSITRKVRRRKIGGDMSKSMNSFFFKQAQQHSSTHKKSRFSEAYLKPHESNGRSQIPLLQT